MWAIGDWGRASEHIGDRWEAVAADLAAERSGPDDHLIVLHRDPALMAEVVGTNLSHADALRAHPVDGRSRLGLEPLDFKWSLETATTRQVSAETLTRLLEPGHPRLAEAIQAAKVALGLAPEVPIEPLDGRFLAPEHPANRAALRDEPDLPAVMLPVDAQAFFSPLPGWPAARLLARMEGADLDRARGVEAVERYYRLGAGVLGALTRVRTGLFEEEPRPIDVAEEIERLRRQGHARTLNLLLLEVQAQLNHRRALEDQLTALPRVAYPFGQLRADLARLKAPRRLLDSRGALGRIHGDVARALAAQVRAAGRDLVASGVPEPEALTRLAATPERWIALARPQLHALVQRLRAADSGARPASVAAQAGERDPDGD